MKCKNFYYVMILGFILMLGITLWLKSEILPAHFGDISFHLANANGFVKANGPLTWNFWEANPEGRPNNYPPMFHIFLATLLKMGISIDLTAKIGIVTILCGGMLLYSFGLSRLYNDKIAFFAILPLIFSLKFLTLSSMILPATLVLFLSPWLILFLIKQKYLSFASLAILMLYTHMIIPTILLLILFVWMIYNGKHLINWQKLIIIYLIIYFLYLPWLIPILVNGKDYIKYFNTHYQETQSSSLAISIDILIYVMALLGVILNYRIKSFIKNQNTLSYFLSLGIFFLPISFIYSSRGINGHSFLIASLFFGLLISWLFSKKYLKIVGIISIIFILFISCILKVYILKKIPVFIFEKSSIRYMLNDSKSVSDWKSANTKIINIIKQNSKKDETIAIFIKEFMDQKSSATSQIHIANYLGVRADRSTVNLRQPELYFRNAKTLTKAELLIVSGSIFDIGGQLNYLPKEETEEIIKIFKNDFILIETVDIDKNLKINIYKNKNNDTIKNNISSSKFPFWLTDILILGLASLIVWDYNRKSFTK